MLSSIVMAGRLLSTMVSDIKCVEVQVAKRSRTKVKAATVSGLTISMPSSMLNVTTEIR